MNQEPLRALLKAAVAELEAKHMHKGKPFGFVNVEWEAFKGKMIEGDELWEFSSPLEDWRALAGRAGVALVRDGEVIDSIVTKMSQATYTCVVGGVKMGRPISHYTRPRLLP